MKVKVTGPYQIVHEGKVYTDGDTVEARDAEAQSWVSAGYAEESGTDSSPEDEGPDVSEFHTGGGWYEVDGEKVRGEDAAKAAVAKHKKVSEPES